MAALALLVTGLAACDAGGSPEPPEPSGPTTATPAQLTFGAYGPKDQLDALADVTEEFNTLYEPAEVEMETWANDDELIEALKSGEDVPDVFTVSREDLAWLLQEKLTQPVDQLLDERGVDFGDNYSRDGIEAFSAENRLQCMPYGISPMVIFYNKDLVDFDRMERRGLDVPAEAEEGEGRLTWNFDQFAAAADFATRPRRGTKGVYVAPTLEGLAPFIYSGGGQMFDDENDPKSLAFSDDGTKDALERSLELFRSPTLTLSEDQLEERTPLQWFRRGKLGMLAGYRELVPGLRRVQGLDFDVIAMPNLESPATVGQVTGLCMSADAASAPAAADFMVHLLDTPAAAHVTNAGYLVPGEHRGRRLRRLPPARPPPHHRPGLQRQRPQHRLPAPALHLARARSRRHRRPRPPLQPADPRQPRRAHRTDRRGQPHRPRPRVGLAECERERQRLLNRRAGCPIALLRSGLGVGRPRTPGRLE